VKLPGMPPTYPSSRTTAAPAPSFWMREGNSTARVTPNKKISWLHGQAGDQVAPCLRKGIDLPSFQEGQSSTDLCILQGSAQDPNIEDKQHNFEEVL